LALSLLFLAWGTTSAAADTMDGVVFAVIDGDTVLFKPDHYHPSSRAFLKVRLAGIDAPEQDQPYGDAATRALKALVLKRRAMLEIIATDVYGRKVGRLTVGAVPVNAEMVRRGFAWVSTRGGDRNGMLALQHEARREQVGLWQDAEPTPPWMWRKAQPALAD
jgi:endonuclease YncB( thermonuclease family)